MNQQIKLKWLNALRSGEYAQTSHHLKTQNGYCCLGVLCDLHARETGNEWTKGYASEYQETIERFNYLGHTGMLPREVRYWAEFENPDDYALDVKVDEAMEMNDEGVNFSEIADFIEREM